MSSSFAIVFLKWPSLPTAEAIWARRLTAEVKGAFPEGVASLLPEPLTAAGGAAGWDCASE